MIYSLYRLFQQRRYDQQGLLEEETIQVENIE